jgi:hypothetical protein
MVESPPGSPFEITQAHFLLQVLVILLDPPSELGQGDLPLFPEDHALRHPRLAATFRVIGPFHRQVQAVGNGEARMVVDQRDADCDLAIGLPDYRPTSA